MDPERALELQVLRYREMTGEERLAIAFRLHELSCEIAREGIRRQHPGLSEADVERRLRDRLLLLVQK